MALWKDDYLIGIAPIDQDHKAFFDLVDLLDHSDNTFSDEDLVVKSVLNILMEYVDGHFYREEKAMMRAKYPRVSHHKRSHEMFRGKVVEIVKAYDDGVTKIANGLSTLVANWLVSHIAHDDKEYVTWITGQVDDRPLVFMAIESIAHRQKVESQNKPSQPDVW